MVVLETLPNSRQTPMCLAGELPELGRKLRGTIETVEPGFMRICQSLQDLSIDISRLHKSAFSAIEMIAFKKPDNPMNQVLTAVDCALEELNRDRAGFDQGQNNLERMMAETAGLKHTQTDFKKQVRRLRIIGLNMSVESVYLEDSRTDFDSFSHEIYQLRRLRQKYFKRQHGIVKFGRSVRTAAKKCQRNRSGGLVRPFSRINRGE